MSITLTSSFIKTFDFEDTLINSKTQTGSAILTGALNCMSERKRLRLEFEVDTIVDPEEETQLELPGSSIWVNIALFIPIGYAYNEAAGPPNTGFNLMFPAASGGAEQEMYFYSNGSIEPDTCKNYRAWLELMTDTTFALEFEFYNTFDENGYLNSTAKNNEYRFLSEMWNEQNFNEISASVFQMSKEIRVLTYIRHADLIYSEKQQTSAYQGQSTSYNTATSFRQEEDQASDELTILNSVFNTPVFVTLAAAADLYTEFYAKLIRIQNNSALDFVENYELSENKIEVGNLTETAIVGPFTVDWNGVDGYELSFDVNAAYITDGAQYRLIVMAYGGGTTDTIAKFGVSSVMSGSGIVSYCARNCEEYIGSETASLLFTSGIKDIDNDWTGNELTCCIEERLRTYLNVDYSLDRWATNLYCRGIACGRISDLYNNDIRKYLKFVTLEIYSEYNDPILNGTVKNRLDYQVVTRTGPNTYVSPAISATFNTVAESLALYYDFRVRNEAGTDCLLTTLNGVPYFPKQKNQFWGGEDLFIKWRLTFEYHDCNPIWQDNIDIIQKLHVRSYDPTVEFVGTSETLCLGTNKCFYAHIPLLSDPEEYKLINSIEKTPAQGGLEESENFTPDILPKETSAKFLSQETLYDAATAKALFCLDSAELEEGETYTITAMAKKIIP